MNPRRTAVLGSVVAVAGPIVSLTAQSVSVRFEASAPQFAEATDEYRSIWANEGRDILRSLTRTSELEFPVESIAVSVMEGPSWAGRDRMGMRASYPPDTKRATLAHELGHILIGDLIPEDSSGTPVVNHHRFLFLFLYDMWVDLWGEAFAKEQVAVESRRRGIVDYEGIWREVLAMDASARAAERRNLIDRWRRHH